MYSTNPLEEDRQILCKRFCESLGLGFTNGSEKSLESLVSGSTNPSEIVPQRRKCWESKDRVTENFRIVQRD